MMYAMDKKNRAMVSSADGVNWAIVDDALAATIPSVVTPAVAVPGKGKATLTPVAIGGWTGTLASLDSRLFFFDVVPPRKPEGCMGSFGQSCFKSFFSFFLFCHELTLSSKVDLTAPSPSRSGLQRPHVRRRLQGEVVQLLQLESAEAKPTNLRKQSERPAAKPPPPAPPASRPPPFWGACDEHETQATDTNRSQMKEQKYISKLEQIRV